MASPGGPLTNPPQPSGGLPADLLSRSRVLARIVAVGAIALVALLLALPFTMEHPLAGAQLLLWAALLLIVTLIAGIALAYSYILRAAAPASALESPGTHGGLANRQELTLQLLPEDERTLYRRIVHEGGELLQKDLPRMLPFSGPKVTRLLDRLEAKGLVVRERHGMTNRIRLLQDGEGPP